MSIGSERQLEEGIHLESRLQLVRQLEFGTLSEAAQIARGGFSRTAYFNGQLIGDRRVTQSR